MVLDDIYEKHYCDILLNHNIYAKKQKYKDLVPKKCKLKCGAKYTLIRDEFIKEKAKKTKKFNIQNSTFKIFIAMGGADTANLNIKILKVLKSLKKFKKIKINLVTTNANKKLKKLKKYCQNKKRVKLHINSTKIAKLMRKSDLAIVTPSVTLNEVYYMKLPFIVIKTADNQNEMYRFVNKLKLATLKKWDSQKLIKLLKGFV
jgi:UDP-2,4-diacetamido-2,4,6-trideoxy-beta-L-altropyranose hydrolase